MSRSTAAPASEPKHCCGVAANGRIGRARRSRWLLSGRTPALLRVRPAAMPGRAGTRSARSGCSNLTQAGSDLLYLSVQGIVVLKRLQPATGRLHVYQACWPGCAAVRPAAFACTCSGRSRRGDDNFDDSEPVEQIAPKSACHNVLGEIPVRRGDHANVDGAAASSRRRAGFREPKFVADSPAWGSGTSRNSSSSSVPRAPAFLGCEIENSEGLAVILCPQRLGGGDVVKPAKRKLRWRSRVGRP